MCHMSHVTCHRLKKWQSGGASRWRVCYERGLPRLVSTWNSAISIAVFQRMLNIAVAFTHPSGSCSPKICRLNRKLSINKMHWGKLVQAVEISVTAYCTWFCKSLGLSWISVPGWCRFEWFLGKHWDLFVYPRAIQSKLQDAAFWLKLRIIKANQYTNLFQ